MKRDVMWPIFDGHNDVLIGIDHVALGSDFDGAIMPNDLVDAAGMPKLIERLSVSGIDDELLAKVTYRNWIRILETIWKG